jgi:hypothetical protein
MTARVVADALPSWAGEFGLIVAVGFVLAIIIGGVMGK